MKKNLFLFALAMGSSFSLAQMTFNVKADTDVKVNKSTLLYVNGTVKVENYNDTSHKISNEGYVRVTGGFTNANSGDAEGKDGNNFVNEYVPSSHYGQLIIDNAAAVSGQIESDLKLSNKFAYHPIAFPYVEYTYENAVRDAFANPVQYFGYQAGRSGYAGKAYDGDRYKNPLFLDNNDNHIYDHVAEGTTLKPGLSYGVNVFSNGGANANVANTADVTKYHGKPNNADVNVSVTAYEVGLNSAINKYGEAWGSYISDFTQSIPNGWATRLNDGANVDGGTFGDNIFWLGNPYTSNIKLSNETTFLTDVKAIYQPVSNVYTREEANGDAVQGNGSLVYTVDNAGDEAALVVRPFHTFHVKTAGNKTFNFTQAMKTFTFTESNVPNSVLQRGNKGNKIYQVGMDVYDGNVDTGSRFYVVAGDIYQAEEKGVGVEAYNHNFNSKNLGVYTLQEKEDGSVAEKLAGSKTYINGVNMNYVGKPIQVVFNAPKGGTFTFKPRLNEDLAKSKYNFYFEDKQEGVVKKVDENFEYTFNVSGTTKDRFVMYWMETPSNIKPEEIDEVKVAQTVVFKDADEYKVRFDSEWKKADVYVYSISGQLISSDKNVSTAKDYTLKLGNNANVYVVKTVGDNGQTVTKKIIK